MKKHVKLFEEFTVGEDGKIRSDDATKYPHINKFIQELWDGDVDTQEILIMVGGEENSEEILTKTDELLRDVQAQGVEGLPFPDDPQYELFVKHPNFESYLRFRKILRTVDDIE